MVFRFPRRWHSRCLMAILAAPKTTQTLQFCECPQQDDGTIREKGAKSYDTTLHLAHFVRDNVSTRMIGVSGRLWVGSAIFEL